MFQERSLLARAGVTPALALVLSLTFAVSSGCRSSVAPWSPTWDAPYGRFEGASHRGLTRARAAWDEQRLETAWRELQVLTETDPLNIEAALLRQELEAHWVTDAELPGELSPELAAVRAAADPADALRVLYLERSRAQADVISLVLAARLESDALAALYLLEQAVKLEPECAPAHYGRAYFLIRQTTQGDRWSEAEQALRLALELDSGNPRFRRMEAWMLSNAGNTQEAAQALEAWLGHTEEDPRLDRGQRLAAQLDLARVWISRDRLSDAFRLLDRLEAEGSEEARRLSLLACLEEARGRPERALAYAREAEAVGGLGLLPLRHQARLLEEDLGEPEAASFDWQRIVDASEEAGDLASLLASVRARVSLERLREREGGQP